MLITGESCFWLHVAVWDAWSGDQVPSLNEAISHLEMTAKHYSSGEAALAQGREDMKGGDFSGAGRRGKAADALFEESEQHDQRLLVRELQLASASALEGSLREATYQAILDARRCIVEKKIVEGKALLGEAKRHAENIQRAPSRLLSTPSIKTLLPPPKDKGGVGVAGVAPPMKLPRGNLEDMAAEYAKVEAEKERLAALAEEGSDDDDSDDEEDEEEEKFEEEDLDGLGGLGQEIKQVTVLLTEVEMGIEEGRTLPTIELDLARADLLLKEQGSHHAALQTTLPILDSLDSFLTMFRMSSRARQLRGRVYMRRAVALCSLASGLVGSPSGMEKFQQAAKAARKASKDLPHDPHGYMLLGGGRVAKLRAAMRTLEKARFLARKGGPVYRRIGAVLSLAKADLAGRASSDAPSAASDA
ncbi:hypothetical protein T484DRAFT_1825084 [Baffinella frigidus]|nr:hypothetical protein T484DRAFT_1825084 [Cryptophyta sp. CCMP2293]